MKPALIPMPEQAYKRIGFSEVAVAEYPEFLQERCAKYRSLGYSIVTMRRENSHSQST
ncbi:hypothetical protein [Thaumasiovibrio sp. DFM-14]|uniref:hypothetical protein n=1 Tax=Thaumasiovibrio sp. DFM-14 TaxID=3384792 RepID=UPI0039A077B9